MRKTKSLILNSELSNDNLVQDNYTHRKPNFE